MGGFLKPARQKERGLVREATAEQRRLKMWRVGMELCYCAGSTGLGGVGTGDEIISGIGPEGCLWDFEVLGELKELCGFPSLPSDPMSAGPQHKMQKCRFTFELLF